MALVRNRRAHGASFWAWCLDSAPAGYEYAVDGATDGETHQDVKGDIRLRLTFC